MERNYIIDYINAINKLYHYFMEDKNMTFVEMYKENIKRYVDDGQGEMADTRLAIAQDMFFYGKLTADEYNDIRDYYRSLIGGMECIG